MATIQGKVIQVKLNTTIPYAPQSGKAGGYSGYKLVYENDNGETKEIVKHMNSLKFTPAIRAVLEDLKPGDDFTLVQEKVGNFLEVRALTKGRDENAAFNAAVDSDTAAKPAPRSYPAPRNTGSTYETPEERKVKQRLIVRQAAINQAINWCDSQTITANKSELLELAEDFENWVYRGIE